LPGNGVHPDNLFNINPFYHSNIQLQDV